MEASEEKNADIMAIYFCFSTTHSNSVVSKLLLGLFKEN